MTSAASSPRSAGSVRRRTSVCAVVVALGVFALYRATLLPGLDFGDTASFQEKAGSPIILPRDGYPLYFAIANAVLGLTHAEPAPALNFLSALEAAAACGLLVVVAAELSGSVAAGVGAALLFGVSYTFWSQAVIAEVYALHMVFVLLTLLLLLRWQRRPTTTRLAVFFAIYALGFVNHLTMILLAPAYGAFLLLAAPGGWRMMLSRRVITLALVCAVAGAAQYAWNLRGLWLLPHPPDRIVDGLWAFWSDVTKADWRDTLVFTLPRSMLGDRAAMYWFDLTQQFGISGPLLALAGVVQLAMLDRNRAALVILLYVATVTFGFSYNVGDTHVFYLTSHLMIALMTAPGAASLARFSGRAMPVYGLLLAVYAGGRAYSDLPALDRSHDTRPSDTLTDLTAGIDSQHAILLTTLNWQVQNGLAYFGKLKRPDVAYARMPDVLDHVRALVADNVAINRRVLLTTRARDDLKRAYGPLFELLPDLPMIGAPLTLREIVSATAPGTRYVLCILKPTKEHVIDRDDLALAMRGLTHRESTSIPEADYVVIAGTTGEPPVLVAGSNRPFASSIRVGTVPVDIRMDSWLAADTMRRMGF